MRAWRAIAGIVAALALAAPARAQPPLWTVHGRRGEVVLFGSVHLLPEGLDWRPTALRDALSEATDLWFEIPIDQTVNDAAVRIVARQGRLPPGDSLWRHLTTAQSTRLAAAASSLGLSRDLLTPMRPWLVDLTLSLADDARSGGLASGGVEAKLQEEAPGTVRRHALETASQQVSFLAAGSLSEQVGALDETVRELTTDPDIYARTVAEWMAGDLGGLRRDVLSTMKAASPRAYRRLIANRNRRWAVVLERVARRSRGVTVVVVGAGHLIGPDGLPAMLRARGLRVDGPD